MKCKNCGFESEQDFEYCVNCGAPAKEKNMLPVEAVSLNPAEDIVLPALQDKLFLVLCILMSVSCVLSLASSGMPLLNILITVFLWLTYADAQKGFANEKHLQCVSGAVYANYVITNVLSIILLVCGVLLGALFNFVAGDTEFIDMLTEELAISGINIGDIPQALLNMSGWVIGGLFILISVLILVFNLLMMRKIHRFAKSVYMGIMYQNTSFDSPQAVKNWFVVISVCCAITTIGSIAGGAIAILSSVCSTATAIIVAILINKYFLKQY